MLVRRLTYLPLRLAIAAPIMGKWMQMTLTLSANC